MRWQGGQIAPIFCDSDGVPRLIQDIKKTGYLSYQVLLFNNKSFVVDDGIVGFIDKNISKELRYEIIYKRLTDFFTKHWREYNE